MSGGPSAADPTSVEGPRPKKLLVVTGTGTDVGKTWVTVRLITEWRAFGLRVAVRKPVQSFEPGDLPSDADLLSEASGERLADVCPSHRWYSAPMAPPMAAEFLYEPPFSISDLVAEIRWPADQADIGIVETAGGVLSPVANDGTSLDLATELHPDLVLLISGAALGAINDVSLSLRALADVRGPAGRDSPLEVVLNRLDENDLVQRRNKQWFQERLHLSVSDSSDVSIAGLADRIAGLGT
jgi:dethiobiotin synthetase